MLRARSRQTRLKGFVLAAPSLGGCDLGQRPRTVDRVSIQLRSHSREHGPKLFRISRFVAEDERVLRQANSESFNR